MLDSMDEIETKIVEILSEVSGAKNINPEMDIFALGIDSLSFIQVVMLIEKEWQVEVSFSRFFQSPCAKSFAQLVANELA